MFNNRSESNHPCLVSDFNGSLFFHKSWNSYSSLCWGNIFLVQYRFFSEMDVEFYKMRLGCLLIFFPWTVDVMNFINRFLNIELFFYIPEINHSWFWYILLKLLFWIWFVKILLRTFASIFTHEVGQHFTFGPVFFCVGIQAMIS